MIYEGLKLTILGMGIVFLFLVFLFISINVSSKILKPYTDKELDEMAKAEIGEDKGKLVAIISAAINMYKKQN